MPSLATHQAAPRPAHPVLALAGWLLLCFAAAAIGGIASSHAPEFYAELVRPPWAPPAWVFGPVWTVLYLMMAVAAWQVWRVRGLQGARSAFALFIAQLVVNALWTWLFFGWQLGALAMLDIALLWLLIVATMISFGQVSRSAGLLMLPYLAWVSFAALLNWACWHLNPTLLG